MTNMGGYQIPHTRTTTNQRAAKSKKLAQVYLHSNFFGRSCLTYIIVLNNKVHTYIHTQVHTHIISNNWSNTKWKSQENCCYDGLVNHTISVFWIEVIIVMWALCANVLFKNSRLQFHYPATETSCVGGGSVSCLLVSPKVHQHPLPL